MIPAVARTTLRTAWPVFVMHEQWDAPEALNRRLYELGAADALRNRVTEEGDPKAIGAAGGHISHRRHNMFMEAKDPAIVTLTLMIDAAIRKYLMAAYRYRHDGEIEIQSDTFYQRRSFDENTGVFTHNHHAHQFSVVYYPRADGHEGQGCPLKNGVLRLYDPAFRGDRLWPNNNPGYHLRSHMVIPVRPGSMVVFEGHVPHDSTGFEGDERLCIAALCKLVLPNSHRWFGVGEIVAFQEGRT